MEAAVAFSVHSLHIPSAALATSNPLRKSMFLSTQVNSPLPLVHRRNSKSKLFAALSPSKLTKTSNIPKDGPGVVAHAEKFDWYSQWYPLMPICDFDKRAPHAKRVLGIDVVVWWDRNEDAWKVFNDACPHRLAPLSEGRIDQWGRLQCKYHGWCFNGSGECKFIPQAPPEGPPVHTFKNACVAAYPSTVQNDILWFWPNTDPQYKDIIARKRPPFIPVLDDPSYSRSMATRDIPCGYEVLIENLMDPSHIPYAHYGLTRAPIHTLGLVNLTDKADKEGGRPIELSIEEFNVNGFRANQGLLYKCKFMPPCIFYAYHPDEDASSDETQKSSVKKKSAVVIVCIPVSPGKSRLIWSFPRNYGLWIDKIVPQWMFHLRHNLILDSDVYLLHLEEHKIMDVGQANWKNACFVPTKADTFVIGFRKWLKKYAGGQVDWRGKYKGGVLPPTPPREQLLDRFWSHVVNCRSCSSAYKSLKMVEVMLHIISVASIVIVATVNQGVMSGVTRNSVAVFAVVSFALSQWLAHFTYKNFHFHDYNHASHSGVFL